MKPVFVSEKGGRIFQTGFKQLDKMPDTKREFLTRDVSLFLAVGERAMELHPQIHVPFGDNKQWVGPSWDLQKAIWTASGSLHVGGSVLVYCYYGVNRSGLVAALIIRELLGCTGAEALARLRLLRKGAVGGNAHFVTYLEELPAP